MKGPVKAYKGVDWHGASEFGDYFKVGATYECNEAEIRKSGFHACRNPWHILEFYTPYEGRFLEVMLDGTIDSCDRMMTATQMTVLRELSEKEIITLLIKNRDIRIETCQTVLSEKKDDSIYGHHNGLVVHSTGDNLFLTTESDYLYVLSEGNNARILLGKWSMNNLILSYGDNSYIKSTSSSRIEVYGKGTSLHLTGSNHAVKLAAGTEVYYAGKDWVAGTDFMADTYYTTNGKDFEFLGQKAPLVENSTICSIT